MIKYQLGPISSDYELQLKKQEQRKEAVWIAAEIAADGGTPSYRKVGSIMGVEASTVMRWFSDENMIAEEIALSQSIKNSRFFEGKPVAHD